MHVASKEGLFYLDNQPDVYGIVTVASDGSVYISKNRGNTWVDANTITSSGSRLSSIVSNPQSMILYNNSLFVYDSAWTSSGARISSNVAQSTDGGVSWSITGTIYGTSINLTDPVWGIRAYQSGDPASNISSTTSGVVVTGKSGNYGSTFSSQSGAGTYVNGRWLGSFGTSIYGTVASGPNAWVSSTYTYAGIYKQTGGNVGNAGYLTRSYDQYTDAVPAVQTGIPIWHQASNVFVIGGSDGKVYTSNVAYRSSTFSYGPTVWADSGATAAMSSGSSYIPLTTGYETSTNYAIFHQTQTSNIWIGTTATTWTRAALPNVNTSVDAPCFGVWVAPSAVIYQRANAQNANTSVMWLTQDRGITITEKAMPANKAWIGMAWLQ